MTFLMCGHTQTTCTCLQLIMALWVVTPYIWRHRLGSTFAQLMACCWLHQALTCTNVDSSSVRPSDTHLRAISQEIPQPSVTEISSKITYLKFHLMPPGVKELNPLMLAAAETNCFYFWYDDQQSLHIMGLWGFAQLHDFSQEAFQISNNVAPKIEISVQTDSTLISKCI